MTRKILYTVHRDGARNCVGSFPADHDTQAWANARLVDFALLGVVKVEEEIWTDEDFIIEG